MRIRAFTILSCLLLACGHPTSAHAQTEGIFADFQTSLGDFTCRLDFTNAPMTVSSFIGLATGERSWLDLETGRVENQPFYDGITFHRVVTNFAIQAGSPSGTGTDGPGYFFRDEISGALHDSLGVLSMANSGPNSNGSQFFVALVPAPWLDGRHSVFGHLTDGTGVVHAIESVSVDGNDRPLTDVVIHHVEIRRVGAAAQAFNIHTHGLPEIQPATATLVPNGSSLELQLDRRRYHEYGTYTSEDLITWAVERIALYIDDPPPGNLPINTAPSNSPAASITAVDIAYPGPVYTPPAITNKTLVLNLGGDILTLNVDGSGGGTWTLLSGGSQSSGNINSTSWNQHAYVGILVAFYDLLFPMRMHLVYEDASSGTVRATVFATSNFELNGTFTSSP